MHWAEMYTIRKRAHILQEWQALKLRYILVTMMLILTMAWFRLFMITLATFYLTASLK